ncbi:MAG: sialate O-acetylesterase [Enterococcus raffinosus]
MKSVLLIGQSNMAGRGYLTDVPAIYNENTEMLRNGRWQMMTEPLHFDREVSGIGPARIVLRPHGHKIILMKS